MSTREVNDRSVRRLPRREYEAAKQKLFAQIREAQDRTARERFMAELAAKHPERKDR